MIASLETARSGLELQLRDGESALARLDKLVLDLRSAAATLTRERDTARNEVLIATVQKNRIEIALKEEVARGQVRDRQVAAKVEALAAAEQRKMSKQADVTISDEAMANLQRRFDALQAQILKEPAAETNDHSWPDPAARALRNAIVAAGDDALRLLGHGINEPASGHTAVLDGKEP